jgi:hypothetical protein
VSEDTNLNASGSPALSLGFSRRTIAILLAVLVGLATSFLILTGGGGGTIAHAETREISAKALIDHECDATEWHFVINQVDTAANAPASIFVTWANGATEDVPLDKYTGKVAHYVTTANLDSTVVSATADIYAGWSGQFNLSHGPCGPSPSPTPSVSTTS